MMDLCWCVLKWKISFYTINYGYDNYSFKRQNLTQSSMMSKNLRNGDMVGKGMQKRLMFYSLKKTSKYQIFAVNVILAPK